MSNKKDDKSELGTPDKIEDMGDLYGNPINTPDGKPRDPEPEVPDFGLTTEEEEMLKKKLEKLRKQDPFIYR